MLCRPRIDGTEALRWALFIFSHLYFFATGWATADFTTAVVGNVTDIYNVTDAPTEVPSAVVKDKADHTRKAAIHTSRDSGRHFPSLRNIVTIFEVLAVVAVFTILFSATASRRKKPQKRRKPRLVNDLTLRLEDLEKVGLHLDPELSRNNFTILPKNDNNNYLPGPTIMV
ncbi:uncharacterized protein LOC118413087 [Branchiostoma floridae]|uniref:Uncharacterized protein LOC118413087 n=1 Tax=Branchiostoma floridae TaxID=7739 RepID=A0A9J7KX33_BRAFL|nr:uncharacterized protein LOC118413087 [Branchiostoma floridae]